MKQTYVEYTCDHCGMADHFLYGHSDNVAKKMGWIIKGKHHFCSEECYKGWKNGKEPPKKTYMAY